MEVIDKILNEWSFRCHDGVVDMNDPNKVSILSEILKEYNLYEQEEDIETQILNLLIPASAEKKQKVLSYLQGSEDEKEKETEKTKNLKKELIQILIDKNIDEDQARYIVLMADDKEELTNLSKLINSLTNLEPEGKLEVGNLKWINNIIPSQASLGTGKGEVLLALMLDGGKLSDDTYKDIDFNGETIEVKQNTGNKSGAVISDLGRSDYYKVLWNEKILDGGQDGNKQSFKEKYNFTKLLSTWNPIFKKYKEVKNKEEYINDLKTVMKRGGFKDVDELINDKVFNGNPEYFYKIIARCAVGDYLEKENKILVLLNSNLEYLTLNPDQYKNQILSNNNIIATNNFSPRVGYKEVTFASEEEESPKPKLSAPEIVQQNIKKQEEKTEEEILKDDSKAQQLKDNFEKAKEKLENIRNTPDYFKTPEYKKILDKYNSTKKQYDEYILQSKRVRKNLAEELTNYLIKSLTEE
jgi:hypothetical protein